MRRFAWRDKPAAAVLARESGVVATAGRLGKLRGAAQGTELHYRDGHMTREYYEPREKNTIDFLAHPGIPDEILGVAYWKSGIDWQGFP